MQGDGDERKRQVLVGVGILGILTLVVAAGILGWRHLPGLLGEWIGLMVGVVSTPFFLEASFLILGMVIVVTINQWRARRGGEEWVTLEVDAGLPGESGQGKRADNHEG